MIIGCRKLIKQIKAENSKIVAFLVGEHEKELEQLRAHYEAQLAERDAFIENRQNNSS